MKGDFTRSTYLRERRYSGVRMQQGRVQLDADWNEQVDIQAHLDRTTHTDALGPAGVPKEAGGFAVTVTRDGKDLILSAGRLYVDGVLCQLEASPVPVTELGEDAATLRSVSVDGVELQPHQWAELSAAGVGPFPVRILSVDAAGLAVTFSPALSSADKSALDDAGNVTLRRLPSYTMQPHLPDPPGASQPSATTPPLLGLSKGTHLAYLDVWERHVTALEDGRIREVALGGPDTATRTQVVWQLKLQALPEDSSVDCASVPTWSSLVTSSTGSLASRAQPETTSADLCTIPPGAGYRRLENQLYRVEVHEPGKLGKATFKWSRENGSVVVSWSAKSGDRLTVSSLGPDAVLGFSAGDWVELTDDNHELMGQPGTLVKLKQPEGGDLVIDATTATGSVDVVDFPVNAKIRRWDDLTGLREVERPGANDGWLALEDGVEIRFEPGHYQAGDHWTIPARTAEGDVDWLRDSQGRPLARPAEGVTHHYAALALVHADEGTVSLKEDCRVSFPSLTSVCAEDVCFDNTACDLPGVDTVQDALDQLCRENDLRHHNKHLHGWGIVCGLQVVCGPQGQDGGRRSVTVRPGYAIDCDGNDVFIGKDGKSVDLDVIRLAEELAQKDPSSAPLKQGDRDVCLVLDPRAEGGFRLERYQPASKDATTLLAGTLLLRFYTECIKPVEDFFRKELGLGNRKPAGAAEQRMAALVNLVTQPVNPGAGQTIYISPREHRILADFYAKLRALLQSETFCAMFERARPFPDYFEERSDMDTIFGSSHHTRLRVRPGADEAYSVGSGLNPVRPSNVVNRYDLSKKKLVGQFDPLAGTETSDAKSDTGGDGVQDVGFSADGRRIYVIVPARGGENTVFRTGDIREDTVRWQAPVTICGVKLVTLATTLADEANLYAIGSGKGLYRINPRVPDASPQPLAAFWACGHLEMTGDGRAFVTASSSQDVDTCDRVMAVDVSSGQVEAEIDLRGAIDDLAVASRENGARQEKLYTVVRNGQARWLLVSDPATLQEMARLPLSNTAARLEVVPFAQGGPVLLVSSEDGYSLRMARVNPSEEDELEAGYILPMQVSPVSMAVDRRRQSVYVLNDLSNTVTVVPKDVLDPAYRFPLGDLAAYRKAVLESFTDLAAGFLQYLKDCLCDKFLVDCPECTGDQALYLACISIRDEKVHKVCNFSSRKYVKSFPTLSYWLSVVPILPLLDWAVEQFCCLVLPDIFGRYSVAAFEGAVPDEVEPRVRSNWLRGGVASAQAADLGPRVGDILAKLGLTARLTAEGVVRGQPKRPERAPVAPLNMSEVVGQPVQAAEQSLLERGLHVDTETYRPQGLDALRQVAGLLGTPDPEGKVTLYEEAGRVRSFSVEPSRGREEVAPPATSEELDSLRSLVRDLEERQAILERDLSALREERGGEDS